VVSSGRQTSPGSASPIFSKMLSWPRVRPNMVPPGDLWILLPGKRTSHHPRGWVLPNAHCARLTRSSVRHAPACRAPAFA
jgi:hypothetical protein